ncbi:MAG: hypothetical protein V1873_08155 [Verrucomicrobiota bacterium]
MAEVRSSSPSFSSSLSGPLGLLALWVLLAVPRFAASQEPPEEFMPPPGEEEMAPPPMGGPAEPGPEAPPPGAPVDQWMERMKQDHPAEFERLRALREKNPEGFRWALHQRVREGRVLKALRDYPKVFEFLMGLPEDERAKVLLKLAQAQGPRGGPHGPPAMLNPEILRLETEARQLSRTYRETTDETARQKLREDLRQRLEALFDLREKERAAQIERIQADVSNLKKALEDRKARREEIISRRLDELTDGDALKW